MKLIAIEYVLAPIVVAPYRGAWIEMFQAIVDLVALLVAPYRGAWIEMIIV